MLTPKTNLQYHDFFDVFLQPFSFKQKAECHVQESSGWRRFGSDEAETHEFGIKEPLECEERSSVRVQWSKQPGVSRIGSEWCFGSQQETVARHQSKPNNVFSRETTRWGSIFQQMETGAGTWTFKLSPRQETGARWGHPNRKVEVSLRQHADLPWLVSWERLQESAEKLNLATYWFGDCSYRQQWKPSNENLEVFRNTNFEELWNLFHITQKLVLHHRVEILNWKRLNGHLLHGRDPHFLMTKWSSGRKREYANTQIPSYACGKCQII